MDDALANARSKSSGKQGPVKLEIPFRPKGSSSKVVKREPLSSANWMSPTEGTGAVAQPPGQEKPILQPPPPDLFQEGTEYSTVQTQATTPNQLDSCLGFHGGLERRGSPSTSPEPGETCQETQDEEDKKGPRPETPPDQLTVAEVPMAPMKPNTQKEFWESVEPILFEGWSIGVDPWDSLDEDDDEAYERLFPQPDNFDEILLPLKRGWQYFPASKTGVVDGKKGDLHKFTSTLDDSPSKPPKVTGPAAE